MTLSRSLRSIFAAIAMIFPHAALADYCEGGDHILQATTTEVSCLTLDDLREIGMTTVNTSKIWTEGVHEFNGVLLRDLLDHLDAEGSEIEATAINDYAITIPISDAVADGPIIAYEMDGATMTRRQKGPLWVIYPFDSSSKYRTETVYSRSIWQLNRMVVRD